MIVYRPACLRFELRDDVDELLGMLLSADSGSAARWWAVAAHLDAAVPVIEADMRLLQAIPSAGVDADELGQEHDRERLSALLRSGLALSDAPEHAGHRDRDDQMRRSGWWGPAALAQVEGRWDGVDVGAIEASEGKRRVARMVEEGGLPPVAAPSYGRPEDRIVLPPRAPTPLSRLLEARSTCRNFDPEGSVSLEDLAAVLQMVFGAQAERVLAPGVSMLKKYSPSGGGLHPTEAFLIARRVAGLATGLYHYQCQDHRLEPLASRDAETADRDAHELVAGQHWFADSPVLILMAARFARTNWKYPRHAKAWKVAQLDAGHLSQTLYLAATELGHGAFITGAINDRCAERLFDLDGLSIGAVAVCGFGPRASELKTAEFDPLGKAVR